MNGPALAFVDLCEAAGIAPDEPVAIGSDAHKTLFCQTLLDTFNPYLPAVLDWPKLDDAARARLVSLPIWDIAVQTEGKAGRSEERRVGKECSLPCRSRWSPYH